MKVQMLACDAQIMRLRPYSEHPGTVYPVTEVDEAEYLEYREAYQRLADLQGKWERRLAEVVGQITPELMRKMIDLGPSFRWD